VWLSNKLTAIPVSRIIFSCSIMLVTCLATPWSNCRRGGTWVISNKLLCFCDNRVIFNNHVTACLLYRSAHSGTVCRQLFVRDAVDADVARNSRSDSVRRTSSRQCHKRTRLQQHGPSEQFHRWTAGGSSGWTERTVRDPHHRIWRRQSAWQYGFLQRK